VDTGGRNEREGTMKPTRRQALLAAMVEEARRRTQEGCSLREVVKHVAQVRDDMKSALRHGVIIPRQGQEKRFD